MNKIRRVDAIAQGAQRYFTGKACKVGHLSERYAANGHCVECQAKYSKTQGVRDAQSQYRLANKEKQAAIYEVWYERNKSKKLEYMRSYSKHVAVPRTRQRYTADHIFAVATRARARLSKAIQRFGYAKNGKTHELIGCSYEELCEHIEAQFVDGMGWDNRSEWHIDHIVPVASAETEEELLRLFHFTNLQPLWALENRKKGARMEVVA